jgi:hypothetical protein
LNNKVLTLSPWSYLLEDGNDWVAISPLTPRTSKKDMGSNPIM